MTLADSSWPKVIKIIGFFGLSIHSVRGRFLFLKMLFLNQNNI